MSKAHAASVADLKNRVAAKPAAVAVSSTVAASKASAAGGHVAPSSAPSALAPSTGMRVPSTIGVHVGLSTTTAVPAAAVALHPSPAAVHPPTEVPAPVAAESHSRKTFQSADALLNTSAATASHTAFVARGSGRSAVQTHAKDAPDAAASGSGAPLPAGFFDDVERDLRARGLDPKAVARAALEREWNEFKEFAAVVEAAEEERAAEELASYEEQQAAAAVENALYRGRLDVVRFVQQKLQRGAEVTQETPADESTSDVLVEELGGPLSLLTTPDTGLSAPGVEELAQIMAQRRPAPPPSGDEAPPDAEEQSDDFDDLLDWRCTASKRVRQC